MATDPVVLAVILILSIPIGVALWLATPKRHRRWGQKERAAGLL